MIESYESSNKTEITPREHAGWRLRGIQKYLPQNMDPTSLELFNKFEGRAKDVFSVSDVNSFEIDLIEQFSADPVLEIALNKRLTIENALSLEFEHGLKKLEQLIQQFEKLFV